MWPFGYYFYHNFLWRHKSRYNDVTKLLLRYVTDPCYALCNSDVIKMVTYKCYKCFMQLLYFFTCPFNFCFLNRRIFRIFIKVTYNSWHLIPQLTWLWIQCSILSHNTQHTWGYLRLPEVSVTLMSYRIISTTTYIYLSITKGFPSSGVCKILHCLI